MRRPTLLAPESGLLAHEGIPIDDFVVVAQVRFNYIFDISSRFRYISAACVVGSHDSSQPILLVYSQCEPRPTGVKRERETWFFGGRQRERGMGVSENETESIDKT